MCIASGILVSEKGRSTMTMMHDTCLTTCKELAHILAVRRSNSFFFFPPPGLNYEGDNEKGDNTHEGNKPG